MKSKMLEQILSNEPAFRIKQAKEGLFVVGKWGWEDISSLPKNVRAEISKNIPWVSVFAKDIKTSSIDKAEKALLKLEDGNLIETVLMSNVRGGYTVCVSTQAGCSIGCAFCATGKTGFKRNLETREIIDQYRFWMYQKKEICNVVFMGMGEPLLNYENVRGAISDILEFTEIGPNHIVVSTVGIMEGLNKILKDSLWPNVRLAISLHSAIDSTRKKIVPAHTEKFYADIIKWAKEYQKKYGSKNRHLSFECVILEGINDTREESKALTDFLSKIGQVKVNLISYNSCHPERREAESRDLVIQRQTRDIMLCSSSRIFTFQSALKKAGFTCTIRKSYGADIQGACGQLAGM